jgi:carbon-monoxide dehydrogenase iron sulfur subunit
MKKLSVKKGSQCMACLECVRACSTAFYKEFHQDKSCIQIIERNGQPKPMVCVQCGKCRRVSTARSPRTQRAST